MTFDEAVADLRAKLAAQAEAAKLARLLRWGARRARSVERGARLFADTVAWVLGEEE
jgi:hypothetical protein